MKKGLKNEMLSKIPIETKVAILQDCIAHCETTAEAQIFRDTIDVLTGKATYVDGKVQRPDKE